MAYKVSVIIPVYNVEQFLPRCVESVLKQTMPDVEIILVDDGSPDQCPEMCDTYAREYLQITAIHKTNGGLASARNAGMRAASGDFIFFLDSDDWIDSNTLQELVEVAEHQHVDFVRFRPMYAGWPGIEDGTLCDFGTEKGLAEGKYTREQILQDFYPRLFATAQLTLGVIVAAWRSLYSRKFLVENNLWFDDQVRYSEDTIFSAKVVRATKSFYYLDGPRYYHYFYNKGSITKSFKADRWPAYKNLIKLFEEAFSDDQDYDFTNQLYLQKLYCIISALGQRKAIPNMKQRVQYCREICCDPVTCQAMRYLGLVDCSSWKMKLMLQIIRWKCSWLLARI